ncbi:aldehyde dehydrogenase family protein [Aquibacillus koreensis]|uniref:3-sulfolactaldehyde dehydrogenase n=1 Tax=Aquibacillus koreensis TaxID=279446 RepID=A0A9X3WHW6_9BACI|nr:aldehyde dehydrogenase family protein [Aquibacillus koreensis]MCT2535797.1 aldehyde dehydrogenase family protein [Aquibacillus koreensis]MDC3420252.1 aldehyde dehydrogenase family protein [Aquibacillus koreensis]
MSKRSYKLYIDGKWIETKEQLSVLDKYTQEVYATVSKAGEQEVDLAITSAQAAYKQKQLPPYERFTILKRIGELLLENKNTLAACITKEAGKPLKQAQNEIERSAQTFEVAAEEAKRIHGEGVPVEAAPGSENRMAFTIKVPVGVVGAISPFNFPLNLVAHKIAPALAAGNAVVLKPASATPITALKLAEIVEQAGLPTGLFNVVVGSGSTVGEAMMRDPRINLFTFTGSAEVGLKLKQNTGLRKLILELGNNSPVIVDKEADIEKAAKVIAQKSFAYAGQVCISVQRLYVHEEVLGEFQQYFVEQVRALTVGDPNHPDTDVGPMISEKEAERAEEWIEEAINGGAKLIHGGQREGAVLQPTVLCDTTKDMRVVCEEVFAPIVSLMPFKDMDKCIDEINESPYGLQGGIFTKNLDTAFYAARKVEVGGLMINDASQYRVDLMPYGGVKDSGNGKEGPKYSIEEMTEERLIVLNLDH